MKNVLKGILPLVFITMLLISCKSEQDSPDYTIETYELNKVKDYVPLNVLKMSKTARYFNELSQVKEFVIRYVEIVKEKNYKNNTKYNTETIDISFTLDGAKYLMNIHLTSNVSTELPKYILEFVHVSLLTQENSGYSPGIYINESGNTFAEPFFEDMTLNGKVFSNVYTSAPPPDNIQSFKQIFYSKEQGIVGFYGDEGVLWALSEYE